MTRKLVFGDDQSQAADVAWLWINLHDWSGWEVEAVTALPAGAKSRSDVASWEPEHPREILLEGTRMRVHHERIAAEPAAALTGLQGRDLLVIGPKGRGLRKAMHVGSTCDALVNNPTTPLVVARHGLATRRVLVCADGSPDSRAAIQAFLTLPWIGRVNVLVMTVPQPGLDAHHVCGGAADTLADHVRSVQAEVATPDELQVVVNPRAMLMNAADRWKADLIVLGTRGLSGFAAFKAGSIATSLARHARSSVLMARANHPQPTAGS